MPPAVDPPFRGRVASRKAVSLVLRTLALGVYGAALLAGGLCGSDKALHPAGIGLLTGFIAYFLWRIHALLASPLSSDIERVEVGLLAVLATATVLEITAPPPSWHTAAYGALLVGLAASVPFPSILALPLASVSLWQTGEAWLARLSQLELLAATAGIVVLLERRRRKKLEVVLKKLQLDTEHFEARVPGETTAAQWDLARLDEVLYGFLKEVKGNTDAHGALLGVKTSRGELYVRELVSDSHNIRDEAVLHLDGTLFQWILHKRRPLRIGRLKNPSARLGYYASNVPVKSFLGVPLKGEGAGAEGVLAVDSLRENAFSEAHVTVLKVASHQVATILTQLRVLDGAKREARDFRLLHEFSKRLSACHDMTELMDLVLASVRDRIRPDFSAVALLNPEDQLSVEAVGEPEWAALKGGTFDPTEGLAGWVMSSRQYLHYDEGRRRAQRPLLGQSFPVPEFSSLMLHPLETHGAAFGVLCLGCRSPRAFDQPTVAFCEVLAQQGAQEILQIRNREQLRTLATTDELTGLANRGVLFERLPEEISRCHRYDQDLTLLLLDVDHFKQIKDRYGHLAGDEVLRQAAATVETFARETDLVARFGGEEFAVLLPNTGEQGALTLAGRVRAGIEALQIEWQSTRIPVRVSVGVATLEHETDTARGLIAKADQALYTAKERGRNRVIAFSELRERTGAAAEALLPPFLR
jgi:diguanylate cyclase (GGDEF)-like protein